MMTRKLTLREKILFLILAVLLLSYGYYLLVHQPVSAAIAGAQVRQADAETQIMVEQIKAQRLREMKDALAQLALEPQGTVSEIATYDNVQNVVRTLNSALSPADSYNLVFSPVTFEGHIASRTIDMLFSCGSYTDARGIISRLYASPYRCAISALSLTAQNTDGAPRLDRDGVSVKLTITFFEYAQQAAAE